MDHVNGWNWKVSLSWDERDTEYPDLVGLVDVGCESSVIYALQYFVLLYNGALHDI